MLSQAHLNNLSDLRSTFDLWQVFSALGIILFSGIVLLMLKITLFRRKYNKLLPGKKHSFLNILGDLSEIRKIHKEKHKLSAFFQTIMTYGRLYSDKQIFCLWFSYVPFIFIMKAEAAEALLSGTKHIEKGWYYNWLHSWLSTGLLTSHGSKWKSRRKLLNPTFHTEILESFIPALNKHARIFVKCLQKDSTDIVRPAGLCTLDIICETIFGVSINVQENNDCEYVKSVARANEIIAGRNLSCWHLANFTFNFTKISKELKQNINIIHKFSMSIIQEKKKKLLYCDSPVGTRKKRMALLDVLLDQHINTKDFSEKDIREEIDTFAFEGHDTLMVGIIWALHLIGLHKDVQDKVHEELDHIFGKDTERYADTQDLKDMTYLACVLKECQRLYPSVPFIGRKLSENADICGYTIPKGTSCLVYIYKLHRDERWFPNPEKFDPDRFLPENSKKRHPYAYIPFSAGPRNCIGQVFAQMTLKIIVSTILRNYSLESLDQREKVPPSFEIILKAKTPIRIKMRPRKNLVSQL